MQTAYNVYQSKGLMVYIKTKFDPRRVFRKIKLFNLINIIY